MTKSAWHHKFLSSLPLLLFMTGTTAFVVLGAWYFLRLGQPPLDIPIPQASEAPVPSEPPSPVTSPSVIQQLALVPPQQREPYLQQAAQNEKGAEQYRARFMLAADALSNKQPQAALEVLKGLEKEYTVLGGEILTLRAQAQALAGQSQEATKTWQTLVKEYAQSPAVVEGLFVLGRQDGQYWDQALKNFPAHPLSVAIAVERLKANPDDLALLRLVARNGFHLPDLKTYLKRLTDKHGAKLTPEDWHAVGFAYWEKLTYKEAGEAYSKAPATPLNQYRAARGLQLGKKKAEAIAGYQKLVTAFPDSKEAAQAYIKLGSLIDPLAARFQYLQKGIALAESQGRSHLVADGLSIQAALEGKLGQPQDQKTTEEKLLTEYEQTNAAASLLWNRATKQAKAGNFAAASASAWAITQSAPQSSFAPKAAFSASQWAKKSGDSTQQSQAFAFLWNQHPDSYYTWRSGSLSGWPVGDFKTVRDLKPTPNWPTQQLPLAAGSEAIQELYLMGQSDLAWKRWLVEFQTREQPSIPEQQADGLIRIGVGEYLDGIFMLNNLDNRLAEEPLYESQVRQWRSHPGFWYALYPLAYYPETAGWASSINMNPFLALGLMRQESRFQPNIRSVVGAVGLMQIMPETGDYIAGKLGVETFDLDQPTDNIRFGTWYLDDVHQTYGNDSILAIASYNAGPGNVAQWVERYPGLTPDEFIDAIPFDETRKYVTAVLENHWNYLRLYDPKYSNLVPNQFP